MKNDLSEKEINEIVDVLGLPPDARDAFRSLSRVEARNLYSQLMEFASLSHELRAQVAELNGRCRD